MNAKTETETERKNLRRVFLVRQIYNFISLIIQSILCVSRKYPPDALKNVSECSYFCGCKFIHISANVLLYPKALSNTNTNREYSLYKQNRRYMHSKGIRPLHWQQYSIPKDRAVSMNKNKILKNTYPFAFEQILHRPPARRAREREGDEKNIVCILCDTREYDCRALLTMLCQRKSNKFAFNNAKKTQFLCTCENFHNQKLFY